MSSTATAAPAASKAAPLQTGTVLVPLLDIRVDPRNRKDHDEAKLKKLAGDIKAEGLLQPIVLRPLSDEEMAQQRKALLGGYMAKFQIIAGERRFLAHRLLKAEKIEAKILNVQGELAAVVKQTVENASREDLNPIDRARQMRRLSELKMPQAEIGKLFGGLSQPTVANALRLLELPGSLQEMVASGELDTAAGIELVRFAPWKKACELIARQFLKTAWSAKNLRERGLPFGDELVKAKLAVEINTEVSSWDRDSVAYTIPAELRSQPGFFDGHWRTVYYLLPEDPKAPNLWEPERLKQDQARAAKEAKERQQAEAAAKKSGKAKPTKEQLERAKKLEENKEARAAIDGCLAHAILTVKAAKGVHVDALAVVCDHVLGSDVASLDEAAAAIGIKLPSKFTDAGMGEGSQHLRALGAEVMVKLAAAAIMIGQSSGARRFAGEVPASCTFVAGKAAKAASVKVTVRWKINDYFAKAGEARATSTSSPEGAARAAAAKHLACREDQVSLLNMANDYELAEQQDGESETWTFTATKGGGK